MSLNKPNCMKLRFRDDLRKISRLPASFEDLRSMVGSLFGPQNYVYRYMDEEGDLVTMASDQELQLACDTAQGPSLKVVVSLPTESIPEAVSMSSIPSVRSETIPPATSSEEAKQPSTAPQQERALPHCPLGGLFGKVGKHLMKRFGCHGRKMAKQAMLEGLVRAEVCAALGVPPPVTHYHVKCDDCACAPIQGVRYKCTVCPNFDLCGTCEAKGLHPHPLLKINAPSDDVPYVRCQMKTREKPPGKPRMDFIKHETYPEKAPVTAGNVIEKVWKVKNPGPLPWPASVRLVMLKGNLVYETQVVDGIEPGQEGFIQVILTVPETKGPYKGIFRLMTEEGKKFGQKLKVKLQGTEPESVDNLVAAIKAMGFDDEGHIRRLLERYRGDANEVITALFSPY